MANELIRPKDLPSHASPVATDVVPSDNGTEVGKVTLAALVASGRPLASQAEAEGGTEATKAMTPLTTKQAFAKLAHPNTSFEGPWETATPYTLYQSVSEGGSSYVCIVAHTSGTFADDLTAGYWTLIAEKGDKGDQGDQGDKGDKGDTGDAATISVGTVSTGDEGSAATVTNSGTSGAAVFDFSIPVGATGATGPQGPQGDVKDADLGTPIAINLANATGLTIAGGGTGAASADAARLGLVLPTYVADLTALGALDTSNDVLAFNQDGAHASWFKLVSGDQSAIVTADPLHLWSQPPAADTTGASGVWVDPDALPVAGFWTDIHPGFPIKRFGNRVFIGAAAKNDGAHTNSQADWLTTFAAGSDVVNNAQLAVLSTIGAQAIVAGTRTSDLALASQGAIGASFYGIHDNSAYASSAYGFYSEAHFTAAADASGHAAGGEIDVFNQGAFVAVTPYSLFTAGATYGLTIASNDHAGSSPEDVSAALTIVSNTSAASVGFGVGLAFGETAIRGTDGVTGTGTAIQFSKGHQLLQAYSSTAGAFGSRITFDGASTTAFSDLVFDASGLGVVNYAGKRVFNIVQNSAYVNGLQIRPAGTGGAPLIAAVGDDTDVDLWIEPKGSGTGKLLNGAESSSVVMWNDTGLGFNNTSPIAKPTVTGSKGSNAALASLMTALSSYGLVTDSTS